jgi:hypothetical protein
MFEWITELNIPKGWFYGIIATAIAGVIVGTINKILNHTLATRRDRRKALIQASVKFRFAIDLARIESFSEYHLLDVLDRGLIPGDGEKFEGEFFKHKRAAHEYRIYLPWFERFRFNKAWKKYHGGDEKNPDLFQYCTRDDGPAILRKRLEKLRSIANKK